MNSILAAWANLSPTFQSFLRIVAGLTFCFAGTTKTFAFPGGMPPNGGTADITSQLGIGGIIETVTGILICLGLFTRPAAFLASGTMAVAYWQFHAPKSMWPTLNGGVAALLYCFIFLYFSAAGAGPISLDALRRPRQ